MKAVLQDGFWLVLFVETPPPGSFIILGIEPGALYVLGKHSATELCPQPAPVVCSGIDTFEYSWDVLKNSHSSRAQTQKGL